MRSLVALLLSFTASVAFGNVEGHQCVACHYQGDELVADPAWSGPGRSLRASVHESVNEICLGCHDGTSAPMVEHTSAMAASGVPGSHPTGIVYGSISPAHGGLRDSESPSGLGGTIADDLLVDGRVECTSCHDVHTPDGHPRLTIAVEGSRLCLTCHDK